MGFPVDPSPAPLSPPRHAQAHARGVDSDGDGESDVDYNHQTGTNSGPGTGSRSNPSSSTLATNYRNQNPNHHPTHYASGSNGNSPPFPPQQQHYYSHHHTGHIEALKSRLAPIRHIEQMLISKLVPPNEEEATHLGNGSIGGNGIHYMSSAYGHGHGLHGGNVGRSSGTGEVFVRPTSGWRGALARARVSYPSFLGEGSQNGSGSGNSSGTESIGSDADRSDEAQETLNTLCGDMIQLWQDPLVREVLRRRKIRLEEGSGFFLNDLPRVTSLKYMPSDGV